MTREEKIHAAMAFLGPLLFEAGDEAPCEPIQITFLSPHQAEMKVGNGEPQTTKFDEPPLLHYAIDQFVGYNTGHECEDWENSVGEEHEEDAYEKEENGDIKYDPELIPDHIYHSIVFCQELIDGYPK
jgi:hypothetical protein